MLGPADWLNITAWEWPADVVAWAAVITASGVIWRQALWPGLRAIWAAVQAAPEIPVYLDDIREILRSNVLNKLDDIEAHMNAHEAEARQRDDRLDRHTLQLEAHELRLGKVERALAERPKNGTPEGG